MIGRICRNMLHWWLDYMYVFRWQFRSFFFASKLPVAGIAQRGTVVLVPGVYESWHFMWPIATRLLQDGYSVHVIEKLGYNTTNIPEASAEVAKYISEHDLHNYTIIAHSKGGLIAKYYMLNRANEARIKRLITINTPFSGSIYAYLFMMPSIRAFIPTNAVLRALSKNIEINSKITSIYSSFDPHIPGGSYLQGAKNIQLPLTGHFKIVSNTLFLQHLMAELEDKSTG